MNKIYKFLDQINFPADLKKLSEEDLVTVAEELRQETINAVSETGGHLGASLGVVELTVALHYVFNTPKDKLIWDVGHQSYPHKILTGRRDKIRTLRQGGGISGFTKRQESEYDPFGAAHSSTSISSALGMAEANKLSNKQDNVVAVIGDGAISAGMAYEAMNNAGASKTKMIVVLNDNDMSIARPVGAMSTYLAKIFSGKVYFSLRETIKLITSAFSKRFSSKAGKAEDLLRSAFTGGTLFSSLGFYYLGPIDGHDLSSLVPILKNAKDSKHQGPILIHIKTKKGKGYSYAEEAKDHYHGVSKFNVKTGEQVKSTSSLPSYTKVFANTLVEHAKKDSKIVAITAAMPDGTGIDVFAKEFPERTFDVGIAEQHAVTFAAGLATENYKPYAAIYSTFLQRAYDQVIHDVALQKLPVVFCLDRSGLVGEDGATHHGVFDLAYLRAIPNLIIFAPRNEIELRQILYTASLGLSLPIAIRYPRGRGNILNWKTDFKKLQIGKGVELKRGNTIAILSIGAIASQVTEAISNLKDEHMAAIGHYDLRFVKPLDEQLLHNIFKNYNTIITIEDGTISGGFGSAILEFANMHSYKATIKILGVPDSFIHHGKIEELYDRCELSSSKIKDCLLSLL